MSQQNPAITAYKHALSKNVIFWVKDNNFIWDQMGNIVEYEGVDYDTGECVKKLTDLGETIVNGKFIVFKWIFKEDVKRIHDYIKMNRIPATKDMWGKLKKVKYDATYFLQECMEIVEEFEKINFGIDNY